MTDDFRVIAQEIAEDIASGRLQPGDRLPPQRAFAWNRGIANSTAGRVYGELRRRGLVSGEIGRGTFVRAMPPPVTPALGEPPAAPINLATNYPVLPEQQALLAPVLRRMAASAEVMDRALRETTARATSWHRTTVARGLERQDWHPDPHSLLFTANGRQALAAAFSSVARPGDRIGFEAMTYPVALAIAETLGITPVPLAVDDQGLRPDAIAAAHRHAPLRAIYVQPTLHNPLGTVMPLSRRIEIADLLDRLDGPIAIEDCVYAFLAPDAPVPLRALMPKRTILVDSLSKRIAPGLTLGIISAPSDRLEPLARSIIAAAGGPAGFPLEACTQWIADGTVRQLEQAKRQRAAMLQHAVRTTCGDFNGLRTNPNAYHLMLMLPERMRAETLVAAAAAHGIAITPASDFAVTAGHAPNAVRIGLANLDPMDAPAVLGTLRGLAENCSP